MCNEKRGTGKNAIEVITSLAKSHTDMIVNKSENMFFTEMEKETYVHKEGYQ